MGERLRFAVLGPLRAWCDEEELDLGSPQQRATLGVLLLRNGRQVSVTELVDAVWDDDPPRTAVGTVRTYISRLRRTLGADRLRTAAEGYVLTVDPDEIDVVRFERLTSQAAELVGDGDLTAAHATYARALSLWDGIPLAGVPGQHAESTRTRLAERRVLIVKAKVELDLRLGRYAEAIADLVPMIDEHPLRERPRELWMQALYRSGRQADALAVYEQTRRLLADELGIEPGLGLRTLQQRILAGDPTLERDPPPGSRGLPPEVPDFTGRAGLVRTLMRELTAPNPAVPVVAVSGLGGVGKTSLAIQVAHAVAGAFADGQLYADLAGLSDHPADPSAVLAGFLRALDGSGCALPDGLEERAAAYRTSLSDRRVLVVLDDAVDAEQVRPLLPGTPGSAVIVTSRRRLVGLSGARWTELSELEPSDALALLTRILGAERVAAEPAARELLALCGHLPLAVRIAGLRLSADPRERLKAAVVRLRDEDRRLGELRAGELAVETAFERSYRRLTAGQVRALHLAALSDGSQLTLTAMAPALGRPAAEVEQVLESLVDLHLLVAVGPERYRLPELVRLFLRRRSSPAG